MGGLEAAGVARRRTADHVGLDPRQHRPRRRGSLPDLRRQGPRSSTGASVWHVEPEHVMPVAVSALSWARAATYVASVELAMFESAAGSVRRSYISFSPLLYSQ